VHTLDEIARAVIAGEAGAWDEFQLRVLHQADEIIRRHQAMRKRGLHLLPDDVAEVRTATLERLWRDEFRGLRRYFAAVDGSHGATKQSLESWLYGAIDFAIRDHLRQRYGRAPKATGSESAQGSHPPSKRDLNTHAGELGETVERAALSDIPRMTRKLQAAAILEHAEKEFSEQEMTALRLHYVEDLEVSEIARRLELPDSKAAEKLLRRLNARLRYRFGMDTSC
jgi:DNA-directed RNA polymerase specialized sigma24 family protein